jgi:hypothetical protein
MRSAVDVGYREVDRDAWVDGWALGVVTVLCTNHHVSGQLVKAISATDLTIDYCHDEEHLISAPFTVTI